MAEIVDFGLQKHKIKMDSRYFDNVLSVVAGDTGRRIEVQLLDTNGMVQNTTGLNLRLNADVEGKATYTDATLVDAATGKYQLDLSNGMFLVPGDWQFQWQITDSVGKKLHSFAFTGNVGKNISEGGSQATNFYLNLEDLKAMQDDLVIGGLSFIALGGTTKIPNINTVSKTVELTAPFSITRGKKSATFSSNITIPFDAETFQYVLYDFDSKEFRMVRATSVYSFKENEVVIMTVSFTTGTNAFVKSVYSTVDYTINDVLPNKVYRNGKLVPGSADTILIADFPTRIVKIKGLFFVNFDNRSVRFSSGAEVQIKGGGISHLFLNENDNTLFFEDTIGFNNRKKEWIYLGQLINDGSKFVFVDVTLPYKTNPELDVAMPNKPYYFSPENIPNYYEPNEIETYDLFSTDSAVTKVQHIYDKYEELRTAFPDYIKRTLLGMDQSGTYPIYEYQFNPSLLATPYLDATSNIQKIGSTLAKIIFIAGNHGQERNAIFSTYIF